MKWIKLIFGILAIFIMFIDVVAANTLAGNVPIPPDRNPLFMDIAFVFSIVNITLCAVLIFSYIQIWRKTRSEFAIGLILLSLTLMMHSVFANSMVARIFGYPHYNLGPFTPLPVLFTTLSLGVLLYLASR